MSATGLGINFSPGLQEGFIQERGVEMAHEIAISCTCRSEDTFAGLKGDATDRRREPFCPRCGGAGWLYREPKLVTGLATSIRQQRNILDAGVAQPGDMLFSPMASQPDCSTDNRRIGAWDKLTATWEQPLDDGNVLVRGAGTADENRGLLTNLSPNEDRLWYEPVSAVWCEDDEGRRYREAADFTLGPGKIIAWIGSAPRLGQKYTIKYNALFEWIVYQPPTERRDRTGDLGPLVFLRKRHVVFINSSPVATEADRVALSSRVSC